MFPGFFVYSRSGFGYYTKMKHIAGRVGPKWLLGLIGALVVLCGIGAVSIRVFDGHVFAGKHPVEAAQAARASEFETNSTSGSSELLKAPEGLRKSASYGAAASLPAGGLSVAILMYHHVGPLPPGADALRRDLTVSTKDFEEQVAWLSQQGYVSVTLADVYRAAQRELQLPAKPVVFTFDDGYADVFQEAIPVLVKYRMRGNFAVVPDFLGQPDYATWNMVMEAKQAGMEIVSHTNNHFDGSNPKFNRGYIQENLAQSLRELEARLGPIPRVLVYPYGHFTSEYIQIAQEVGFVMALTTRYGRFVDPDDLMRTPRVRVHGAGTMEKFEESITGVKRTK